MSRESHCLVRRQALRTLLAVSAGGLFGQPVFGQGPVIDPRQDLDDLYDRQVDEAVCRGLTLLIQRQKEDGTFQSKEQGRWVGVVSLAGLAFLSRGIIPGKGRAGLALRRAGQYVLSQVQASGFLSAQGQTSHGPMYDHGFGTLFLSELYAASPLGEVAHATKVQQLKNQFYVQGLK